VSEKQLLLPYPDPPLTDGTVELRRWAENDVGCVEEATFDPCIPEGTTVPATFTVDARVEALVDPDNVVSQRVLERVGFHREGLLRSYLAFETGRVDAFIYALLPSDVA
jgi:hypothetical protein